jgi:hypothetical protein
MMVHRAAFVAIAACLLASACDRGAKDTGGMTRDERRIDEQLAPSTTPPVREGLAAAIVIDVSGSMNETVRGEGGREEPKIAIARRAALDLVSQFARYGQSGKRSRFCWDCTNSASDRASRTAVRSFRSDPPTPRAPRPRSRPCARTAARRSATR